MNIYEVFNSKKWKATAEHFYYGLIIATEIRKLNFDRV